MSVRPSTRDPDTPSGRRPGDFFFVVVVLARLEKVIFLSVKFRPTNQFKSDPDAPRGGQDANEELLFAGRVGKAATRATKHEGYEARGKRKKWQEGKKASRKVIDQKGSLGDLTRQWARGPANLQ